MGKSIRNLSTVTRVGLDLAKRVFQVHAVDAKGEIVVARKLTRSQLIPFFAELPRLDVLRTNHEHTDHGQPGLPRPLPDARRSILRPALIETFVQQRVADPGEWLKLVPQYLRTGTNPAEKNRFLDEICEIIDRIDFPTGVHPAAGTRQTQGAAPSQPIVNASLSASPVVQRTYAAADPATVSRPDRERFYDDGYSTTLKAMIVHVINAEGPIFDDVLVDRIARTHGMQRSGNQIRRRVIALLPTSVSRIAEGERTVIWPPNKDAGAIHFFRRDDNGVRGHDDVPLNELAAIAAPFVRLRMDDESVLRKMAEQFALGRLREATRARFQEAVQIARISRP
jgi:hypothetical protein